MQLINLILILLSTALLMLFMAYIPLGLWMTALLSGVRISLYQLLLMRLRNSNPQLIVRCLIELHKANIEVSKEELEALYHAGGNVDDVVEALIIYKQKGNDASFHELANEDIMGTDVVEVAEKLQAAIQ